MHRDVSGGAGLWGWGGHSLVCRDAPEMPPHPWEPWTRSSALPPPSSFLPWGSIAATQGWEQRQGFGEGGDTHAGAGSPPATSGGEIC